METKTSTPDLLDAEQSPAKLPAVHGRTRAPAAPKTAATAVPTTPMDLLRIVTERGATAEEVGKFMDLMERQQAREAQQAFVGAMVDFKKSIQTVIKNARAAFKAKDKGTGERGDVDYGFATLGHICEAIVADLAERGITHDWEPAQPSEGPDKNMIVVTCVLTHVQGHSKRATVKFPPDPTGTKNALQAVGSALSYAERYSLLAVCGIATKEQTDDDAHAAGNGSGAGDAAGKPPTLSEVWLAKVKAAPTDADVVAVWDAGIVAIEKAKDRAAYTEFKAAVAARRAEFAQGGQK